MTISNAMLSNTLPRLPERGIAGDDVLAELQGLKASGDPERAFRFAGCSYKVNEEVQRVARAAYNEYLNLNAMYSPVISALGKIEDDLLGWIVDIFNGGSEGRANLTCGGSDSIFCAMHAMREWAREAHPEVKQPTFLVPYSAHPAFSRAAHYLGLKIVRIPLREDYRIDLAAMAEAIGPDVIGLVGSAPSLPYGRYDHLEEMSDLAIKHKLWLHADACMGGFLAPFARLAGYPVPEFDFSLPGVTSLSADIHKYGHTPKGISTVVWRSEEYQKFHYAMVSDWPMGPYFSQSLVGSRAAGPVAAAWAVMKHLGLEGKVAYARRTMEIKAQLTEALTDLGFDVRETDLVPLVIGSPRHDIQEILMAMGERGWKFIGVQEPPSFIIIPDSVPEDLLEELLSDFREVMTSMDEGASYDKAPLFYTFVEASPELLESLPLWVQRAISIMKDVTT